MNRDVMKLALDALEGADWYINQLEMIVYSADDAGTHENRLKVQHAITAMRFEIDAENMASKPAQQEPVAWMFTDKEGAEFFEQREDWQGKWTALYTSPPAQRTWVGLTLEELSEIYNFTEWDTVDGWGYERAIEAKLKEKNNG